MTTYEYVARSFNTDGGTGGIVGTNPLDTIDDDTSYVSAWWSGDLSSGSTAVTFRLEPVGPPAPPESTWTSVRSRLVWKRVDPVVGGGQGSIAHHYIDGGSDSLTATLFGEAYSGRPDEDMGAGYVAQWSQEELGEWPNLLTEWQRFGARGASGSPASEFRATYYRVFIEAAGAYPTRLMQRGDNLGMGSGRVYATGTRQNSTRVFGTV